MRRRVTTTPTIRVATPLLALAACVGGGEDAATPGAADTLAEGPAPASVRAVLDEPFDLPFGETAVVGPERLTIEFRRVAEENRCPPDARCPTPGNAAAELAVEAADGAAVTLTLNTGRPPSAAPAYGHLVRLVGLEPSPGPTAASVDTSAYVATLSVAEAEEAR